VSVCPDQCLKWQSYIIGTLNYITL
jgi:hypothetical protein